MWWTSGYLFALLLAQRLGGERYWPTLLATYVPQVVPMAPVLVIVPWVLWRGDRPARVWAVAVAVFALFAFADLELPTSERRSAGTPVRVLTCNIHYGLGGVDRVVAMMDRHRPDVVCLQEVTGQAGIADPSPELTRRLTDWHVQRLGELRLCTRRQPAAVTEYELPGHPTYGVLAVRLDLAGGPLTVFTTHVETCAGPEMLFDGLAAMPDFVRRLRSLREAHRLLLQELMDRTPGARVLCGDFNTPPRGFFYQSFADRYTDAYARVGLGFGYTFRADLPVLRIDYCWLAGGITPVRCRPLPDMGSDHLPLLTDLVLARP